ncbi:MAG TPA: VWA domain-containing protein [Polyangiaceae bacterium]
MLRPSLISGLSLLLLLNCSSSSPEGDRNAASNASGSDGASTEGASSEGSNVTGADTTGSGGVSNTAAAVTSSDGSGATSSGDSSAATTTSDGASTTNTTGPIFLTGVGGSFVGSRDETDACQGLEIAFTPEIPTVFILVDRSSSMWDNMFWDPLRDGVLEVVSRLHEDVRFGFGTYTGIQGDTCPLDLQDVGIIDKNNYAAIEGFYSPIMHPGVSTETPTPAALAAARDMLKTDFATFPGPKFILLVTDGNPDFCDSGATECRADLTVRVLQDLRADTEVPIRTFVVALPDPGIDLDWLTAFANAGAGQPVAAPRETEFCDDIVPATAALFPDLDPTLWPQGSYGETMGPEVPYNVDPAQQDQLVEEIAGVIAGVKSCTFDLEGELEIDKDREDEGTVVIQTISNPTGTAQAYAPDGGDGWKVNEGTQIELVGASCEALRDPETTGIQFGFPCGIIIPK